MSPLARPLLALACAALLHAACAQLGPPHCDTDKQGKLEDFEIELPLIKISSSQGRVARFVIPDNCKLRGLVIQGETAKACDWNAPPNVVIYDHFRKVQVTRNAFSYEEPDATLKVIQYCKQRPYP